MNYIFYQTKTQYTNAGDALINNALINILRNYGKLYANCSREIPRDFLAELGVLEDEIMGCNSEIEFILSVVKCAVKAKKNKDSVYVFSGPGDMYGGGIKLVVRNLISGLIFPVFRIFGVKIVRIGRSVGPVSSLMALSEYIRSVFLNYYYVRDTKSLERCRKMGIKKVRTCPDLSWIYDSSHKAQYNQTNTVMVNLRNSIFDDIEDSFCEATLKKCDETLAQLNECMNGKMTVCVAYQVEQDKDFSKKVFEFLKPKYPTIYIDRQMKLSDLKNRYSEVDYHISNRMHSLLLGYKYGSLPVALIDTQKHAKISATFVDCDLEELMIDIYDNDIAESTSTLYQNRKALLEKILVCEKENNKKFIDILNSVFAKKFKRG